MIISTFSPANCLSQHSLDDYTYYLGNINENIIIDIEIINK